MTNKEIVIKVMYQHPCVSGVQIHDYACQIFGAVISPQSACAVLRPLVSTGLAAQSKHPIFNRNVYWLTDRGKEKLFNEFSLR